MDNIVSIPQQPPYNPSAMAVLTQAAQTIRQNAIVGLAHNQLKAIARMQEQLEPILRMQKQFVCASVATPTLTAWANSLRLAADPLQEARSVLQGMSSEQARIFASRVYGPQMTEALPSGKLSNILSLLLGAGSIAPPEYAHSINLLCFAIAVLLTFRHEE